MMNGVNGANVQNASVCFKGSDLKKLGTISKALLNPDKIIDAHGNGEEVLDLLKKLNLSMWAVGGKDSIRVIPNTKVIELYEDASANIGRNGKKYANELEEAREKVKFKTGIPEIDQKWMDKLKELKYIRILEEIAEGRGKNNITEKQAYRYMDMLDKIIK